MSLVARTMHTSEQIRAEIEQTFGFFPPFFEPALGSPQVLENLWQQTLSAYVLNPLSALFKERLNALLSRFCAAPYCMIVHSAALRPLGMTAQQVLALLDAPLEKGTDLTLGALPAPMPEEAATPAPDSPLEKTLLYCAMAVFLERADAQACQAELRRLLGPDLYPHLVAYLAYIKTCHTWIEAHPEVSHEADRRVQDNLGPLLVEEPALGDFFRHYQERVRAQGLGRERRRAADESLRAEQVRMAGILESITDAFATFDREWRFTYLNDQAARMLSRAREELLGRSVWAAFPDTVGTVSDYEYHRAVEEQVTVSFEQFYPPLSTWFQVRAYPSPDGLSIFFQNVNVYKSAVEERERLLAETGERAEREALLNRISEAIRATTDPEEIQQVAVHALGAALGADRCYFSFYDLAADVNWVGKDFHRADLASLAGRYRLSDFQINPEDYYPSGRTLVVADATANDWSFPKVLLSALRQLRVRSAIGVPIFDGGRLVATLSVAMADEPRSWTSSEVQVAEAVAAQTRSAVEAARLLAEQQASLQHEALVGRIGVAIRSELDPEVIQQTAAQLLGEALNADRCFYLTYDLLRDSATVGRDFCRPNLRPLVGKYRLSDFQEMLAEVFADGTTASIPDVRTVLSPAIAEAMAPFGHRAVLAVPFFDEGRLVAALWASTGDTRAWTAHEAALMEQVATLTRTTLETARVSRKEHAIAEQLQAALQPDLPDTVPGIKVTRWYEPALIEEAGVGGDFYDVFAVEKGCTALAVGDLSGKGLVAAANVSVVRNMLRAFLYSKRTLAEAVTELNRVLAENNLLTGFATLFVGAFDGGTRILSYVNCGQEPALVRRGGAGAVEYLPPTGPILGSIENARYTEEILALSRGDALAIFSDGLTEIGPSRTAMLGIEGVAALLGETIPEENARDAAQTAEYLTMHLAAGVGAAAAGGVPRDDVCLLVAVVE